MIIKKSSYRKSSISFILWLVPLIFAGILFIAVPDREDSLLLAEAPAGDEVIFETDLESFADEMFISGAYAFDGANLRTTDHHRSGHNSVALDRNSRYGLTTWFIPPSKDATYHVSVHRYNPDRLIAPLVIAAADPQDLYITKQEGAYETSDSTWEIIHATFNVPPQVDSVKIYCMVVSEMPGTVFFDDYKLSISDLELVSQVPLPVLDLQIDEDGMRKIKQKRLDAWNAGVLVVEDDDWVKAKFHLDERELKARVRLKGDWLDHLRGNNWSFRAKLKDPDALWGMIEFNLQKPDTRGFMREWIYHQLLSEHDILSPRYRFVVLKINGESRGIYACEEHFQKELVESKNRREGPILKFSEDRLWNGVKRQFDDLGNRNFILENDKEQAFWSAPVEAFNNKAIEGNSDLNKVYARGAELMQHYKYGSLPLNEIFDVEAVGKYLAIIDICQAYHNLTWHNQRWYYNPLMDRLEPIGFDGFTTDRPRLEPGFTLMAEEAYRGPTEKYEPYKRLFKDSEIARYYVQYLDSLSSKNYLPSFFDHHESAIVANAAALLEEYKIDVFQSTQYYDQASRVRLTIQAYPESLECIPNGSRSLYILNHHALPVVLDVRSGSWRKGEIIFPSSGRLDGKEIRWNNSKKFVDFTVLGLNQNIQSPILAISYPMAIDTFPTSKALHPLIERQDSVSYILKSGETNQPIIVPKDKTLLVLAGTLLDLTEKAYMLVEGPILINGSEDQPVIIESSDGTGAVVVRNAEYHSQISNTIFRHLGRVDRDSYVLTGGVTFYQSNVTLEDCVFRDNTDEDALNIVRSNFALKRCLFENTAFDGFDSDFSEGTLDGCTFVNTGNDAIDFSGSHCTISDCTLTRIGDKGVSVGEHSEVYVQSLDINNANIGLASKDLSYLEVNFVRLANVKTGFTAYQKKSTFGPATITVLDYEISKVGRIHLIEQGSTLNLPSTNTTSD